MRADDKGKVLVGLAHLLDAIDSIRSFLAVGGLIDEHFANARTAVASLGKLPEVQQRLTNHLNELETAPQSKKGRFTVPIVGEVTNAVDELLKSKSSIFFLLVELLGPGFRVEHAVRGTLISGTHENGYQRKPRSTRPTALGLPKAP